MAVFSNCEIPNNELHPIFDNLDQNQTGVLHYADFLAATLEQATVIEDEWVDEAFDTLNQEGTILQNNLTSAVKGITVCYGKLW